MQSQVTITPAGDAALSTSDFPEESLALALHNGDWLCRTRRLYCLLCGTARASRNQKADRPLADRA